MSLLDTLLAPERREKARQEQALMRERWGHRLPQHPAQANFAYGLAREQMVLDQISAGAGDETNLSRLFVMLAEGLALQARFSEAFSFSEMGGEPRPDYKAKAEALEGKRCDCPETVRVPSPVDAKGTLREMRVVTDEVWDGSKILTFTRCLKCNTVSYR